MPIELHPVDNRDRRLWLALLDLAEQNNQRADLALLLSFVDDADALIQQLVGRERTWLRHRTEMNTPDGAWWQALDPDARQRGLSALRIVADFPPAR